MTATDYVQLDKEYEWEEPVPLDTGTPPPFPVDALPDVLADYVAAVAAFAEVPHDLPAVLTIATAAAAVARKTRVEVRPDYAEPLNMFAVVGMPSGLRKSWVFEDTTAPLHLYEHELLKRMGPEIAEAQSRARVRAKELQHAERMAAQGGADAPKWDRARGELARTIRDTEVAAEPRVLMAEATPEAIGHGLAEQGGRLAVFSPEGDVFAMLKRYSKDGAPNFEVFLKGHAGDELRIDRRHAAPVTLSHPALTVALAVQPDVLHGLARDRVFRERGLLARFLYAVPPVLVGHRTFDGPPVPETVRRRYTEAVLWLCRWPPQAEPLTLSSEAFATWMDHALTVEHDRAPGGRFAALLDWSGKFPGLVARLAGGLHAVRGASAGRIEVIVNRATMTAAVRLGEYAAAHALAAFGMMGGDPALADAQTVLAWVTRTRRDTFTTRDAYRENRTLETAARARAALGVLVEHGYVRPATPEASRSGRPSEGWVTHPAVQR